jgi:predicted nucleic-acid-binding Zn-ribbon protein
MKNQPCPKCGSADVIRGLPIADHTHSGMTPLSTYIIEKPEAVFDQEISYFMIRAWVCIECGYTELYTDEPNEVAESFKRFLENVKKKKTDK